MSRGALPSSVETAPAFGARILAQELRQNGLRSHRDTGLEVRQRKAQIAIIHQHAICESLQKKTEVQGDVDICLRQSHARTRHRQADIGGQANAALGLERHSARQGALRLLRDKGARHLQRLLQGAGNAPEALVCVWGPRLPREREPDACDLRKNGSIVYAQSQGYLRSRAHQHNEGCCINVRGVHVGDLSRTMPSKSVVPSGTRDSNPMCSAVCYSKELLTTVLSMSEMPC